MTGPQAEAFLAARGMTLGHFPQSFEYATLGGFAATRSAGQASSGYGRFDELVEGLRMVTPSGEVVVAAHPATAAGPSIRQLVLGSEGRLGVITEVTVRVRHAPAQSRYEGWSFPAFADGVAALRALAQGRVAPDVARLSDREETRVGMAMASRGGAVGAARACATCACAATSTAACSSPAGTATPSLPRRPPGPGTRRAAAPRWHPRWARRRGGRGCARATTAPTCATPCSTPASSSRRWRRPPSWARPASRSTTLSPRRSAHALTARRRAPLVGCHVSHVYPSGASLYFTVLAPPGGDPRARWIGRQGVGVRGDPRQRRHHHPPPRHRHRPPPLPRPRGRCRRRSSVAARSRASSIPPAS